MVEIFEFILNKYIVVVVSIALISVLKNFSSWIRKRGYTGCLLKVLGTALIAFTTALSIFTFQFGNKQNKEYNEMLKNTVEIEAVVTSEQHTDVLTGRVYEVKGVSYSYNGKEYFETQKKNLQNGETVKIRVNRTSGKMEKDFNSSFGPFFASGFLMLPLIFFVIVKIIVACKKRFFEGERKNLDLKVIHRQALRGAILRSLIAMLPGALCVLCLSIAIFRVSDSVLERIFTVGFGMVAGWVTYMCFKPGIPYLKILRNKFYISRKVCKYKDGNILVFPVIGEVLVSDQEAEYTKQNDIYCFVFAQSAEKSSFFFSLKKYNMMPEVAAFEKNIAVEKEEKPKKHERQ